MTERKTLGILTFNRAANYGAALQAYAMKYVCDELGYDAHVVNYLRGVTENRPSLLREFRAEKNKKRAIMRLCRKSLSRIWDKRRWKAFADFRIRYLNESTACVSAEEVAALGYDVYISGSDQIWNYRITGNSFDPVYFGDFAADARRIVYAASAHDTPFPLDMELAFRERLEKTDAAIGIRERKLAEYAGDLTGVSYPVVLDPVLLAGREALDRLEDSFSPPEPYILIYQIDANPASDISVKTLEKRFGRKVYTMTVPRIGSLHGRKGDTGPERFLALLKNADFLVTNSFHGIAISLLMEKQFFVYENGGVMTRIDGLLAEVGLHDRKVKTVADIDPDKAIDYRAVGAALEALRSASMRYLTDALDGKKTSAAAEKKAAFRLRPAAEREKADCSGCTACVSVCPVGAIAMKADGEGFLYPRIDESACIRCGRCDEVCGFVPRAVDAPLPKAYGVKHRDEAVRMASRSGAAFVALSDRILENGGAVYGAVLRDDLTVSHQRAVTREERNRMTNAKYVQSDLTGVYDAVIADLNAGLPVLFSGTPCQVSGLTALLDARGADAKELVTCDLVCHGAPSPMVWRDYVRFIEEREKKPIAAADFRNKSLGWDTHCESFVFEGGKKILRREYTDLFYSHIMMRPSCHACHFANVRRPADLTLGDFWGIEKSDPAFDDNKGVSLVLVNTDKGAALLERAKPSLEWIECDLKNCMQPTLVKPTEASPRREEFWADYGTMAFPALLKKYTTPHTRTARIKRSVKRLLFRAGLRKHP